MHKERLLCMIICIDEKNAFKSLARWCCACFCRKGRQFTFYWTKIKLASIKRANNHLKVYDTLKMLFGQKKNFRDFFPSFRWKRIFSSGLLYVTYVNDKIAWSQIFIVGCFFLSHSLSLPHCLWRTLTHFLGFYMHYGLLRYVPFPAWWIKIEKRSHIYQGLFFSLLLLSSSAIVIVAIIIISAKRH